MSGLVSHSVFIAATWVAAIFGGIGIGAAFVSAIVGYQLTEESLAEANRRIAEANAQAEQARGAAAEANARALEAQLALEKFKQPRLLSENKMREMADKLNHFAGTRFDASASAGDTEAVIFLSHIAATLEMAGWKWIEWNPPTGELMTVYKIEGKPNVGQLGFFDVALQVDPDHNSELATAVGVLGVLLKAKGFAVTVDVVANPAIPNKDTIHVIVGKKRG
jgi:hypothetical protein